MNIKNNTEIRQGTVLCLDKKAYIKQKGSQSTALIFI